MYLVYYPPAPLAKLLALHGGDVCLLCSLLHPQCLEWRLAHRNWRDRFVE